MAHPPLLPPRLERLEAELIALARELQELAEPGYEETRTIAVWERVARAYGLTFEVLLEGTTPVITLGDYDQAAKKVIVTADLDAVGVQKCGNLIWRHLCGHHAQSVHALGLAMLLARDSDALPSGAALRIIGCPAEECRPAFDPQWPIPFVPGKQQLLAAGVFADATAILSTHLADDAPERVAIVVDHIRGGIWLRMTPAPELLSREWPESLQLENIAQKAAAAAALILRSSCAHHTYKRGSADIDLWLETAPGSRVSQEDARALERQLAKMFGMPVELVVRYGPLVQDADLSGRAQAVLADMTSSITVKQLTELPGATDLGDVSQQAPTLQLFVGGTSGVTHDSEFRIVDESFAYVWPISYLVRMLEVLGNS